MDTITYSAARANPAKTMDRLLPARLGGLPLLAERGPADCPTHQRADREHPPIPLRRDRKAGTPQEPTGRLPVSPHRQLTPARVPDRGRVHPHRAGPLPLLMGYRRDVALLRQPDQHLGVLGQRKPAGDRPSAACRLAFRVGWEIMDQHRRSGPLGGQHAGRRVDAVHHRPRVAELRFEVVTDPPSRQSAAASLPATPLRCGGRCSSDDRRGREGCRTVPRRTGPTAPARPSRRPRRPV